MHQVITQSDPRLYQELKSGGQCENSNLQCPSSEIQILEVEDDISTTQNECKL